MSVSAQVSTCLQAGTAQLQALGIKSAALDASLLLAHVLARSRSWVYAYPEYRLTARELACWHMSLAQRQARRPLAYIVGRKEFMGLSFQVDERVLIPRPETELLVTWALAWLDQQPVPGRTAADVGTGSGCIALALAHSRPDLILYALDLSGEALQVACANSRYLQLQDRVTFLQGDLLAPLPAPVHLILANLPYVETGARASLAPEIRQYEPDTALFGGPDGLAHMRRLIGMLPSRLRPGGAVCLECGAAQALAVHTLLVRLDRFAHVAIHVDWAGHERYVTAVDFRDPAG